MHLTTPDIIIAGTIVLSVMIGVMRGFVKESISLVSWGVAIVLSIMYSGEVAACITFTKMALVKNTLAFLSIFVGVVFIGAVTNYMIGSFVRKTPFSIADRIMGSLFGLLRGVAVISLVILLAGLTPFPETPWWRESVGIAQFQGMAFWLKDRLPDDIAKVFHFPGEPTFSQERSLDQA